MGRKKTGFTRICPVCNASFYERASSAKYHPRKYCGRKCYGLANQGVLKLHLFWKMVDKDGPIPTHVPHLGQCWIYKGKTGNDTSIRRWHSRRSWLIHFGPIPDHLQVHHHCDNGTCVNPDHLWLGTQKDNIQDACRKGRHWKGGNKGRMYRGGRSFGNSPESYVQGWAKRREK